MISSAKLYFASHSGTDVDLKTLLDEGYLESMKDPFTDGDGYVSGKVTKEGEGSNTIYKVTLVGTKYSITSVEEKNLNKKWLEDNQWN